MEPYSSYQVEQICETVYYQVINSMQRHSYVDYYFQFQNKVEQDFMQWTYPKFNMLIMPSDKQIVYKWQQKIRAEAKIWFENNVQRRRDQEREDERRREKEEKERKQEEEERAAEQHQLNKESNLEDEISERVDELIYDSKRALETDDIDVLKNSYRNVHRYIDAIDGLVMSKVATSRRSKFNRYKERLKEYSYSLSNKISEIEDAIEKAEAEEKARLEAELAAKRKGQEEANLIKLQQMQAQWIANKNPSNQSSSDSINPSKSINNFSAANCPQCGKKVKENAKFCFSCGAKLSMSCPSCGNILKPNVKFCSSCGTPLDKH